MSIYGKVKFTMEQALRPRGGLEVQFYSFFDLGRDGVGGKCHAQPL
jgi:hypothetical protein